VLRGVVEDVNVREVNDLIQSGDKRLTVAAADVANAVPSTADRVLISGSSASGDPRYYCRAG
jgi:hypothetical protein